MSKPEINNNDVHIGRKIEELRKAQGLSMTRLAKIAGTSQPYIGMLEKGERSISLNTLKNICNALGVTLEEFIKDVEPPIPAELAKGAVEYNRICFLGKKLTQQELKVVVQVMEKLLENRTTLNTDITLGEYLKLLNVKNVE